MLKYRVFVYGTLMRGECNHHYLRAARLLGTASTPPCCRLYSLGAYPVLCFAGRQRVTGEVYLISQRQLRLIDALEQYPLVYERRCIPTPFGPAWVYFQSSPPRAASSLPSGRWRQARRMRATRHSGIAPDDSAA